MGNLFSSNLNSNKSPEKEFENFYDIIDHIATYYILTMDFQSLRKVTEKDYCDKLVVLTSDIIKRYFNDMEITYLAQRIKNGLEVNELSKEKVIFINKNQLESLDISNDAQKSIKKKRVCIGIAKFYIKIAHIFAAIVMTINPVYTYKGESGETIKTGLMEKDKIPKNSNRKLFKFNICDNRIRALNKIEQNEKDDNITIQPEICNINTDKTNGTTKSLNDEPGIPELMTLYMDDNYDYSNGTFTGMSEKTKTQFIKDLKTFYNAFTGNENMPPEITKFSDIKLRNFNNLKGCQNDTQTLKNKYVVNKKDKLFIKYAENTKKMIQNAADNQIKLLDVINNLFTYVIDPYSGKKKIRINPKLTEEILQKNIEKTRKLIIDLYINCELDYVNGVKLYEAIVESKILETTQNQIQTLQKEATKIIDETTKFVSTTPQAQPLINNQSTTNTNDVPMYQNNGTTSETQDLYNQKNPTNLPIIAINKEIEAKNEILQSLTNKVDETPVPKPETISLPNTLPNTLPNPVPNSETNFNTNPVPNNYNNIKSNDIINNPNFQNNIPSKIGIPNN